MTKEEQIRSWISKWQRILLLDHWNFYIRDLNKKNIGADMASVATRPDYWEVELTVYECFWEHSAEEQELAVAHEVAHAVLGEVQDWLSRACKGERVSRRDEAAVIERVTEHVARIAIRLLR